MTNKEEIIKTLLSKVTRIEVIDHSGKTDKIGRVYTNYDVEQAELQLQDNEKTLKIFINK